LSTKYNIPFSFFTPTFATTSAILFTPTHQMSF
jgi:hypothetical protein